MLVRGPLPACACGERRDRRALLRTLKLHTGLLAVLCLYLVLVCHYFERVPHGWDQAEYALCVKASYLPHSPYLLYFVAGKLLHLLFAPPVALSVLSALSGVAALCLFYGSVVRVSAGAAGSAGRPDRGLATAATALLGLAFAFVRQAATQEVYVFQTALVLLSLFVLLGGGRWAVVWSGVAFGCAVGAHNSSLFLLPAMVVAAAGVSRGRRARALVLWLAAVVLVCGLWAAAVWLLVPAPGDGSRVGYVLGYLRGISPRVAHPAARAPGFLAYSVRDLWHRLFSLDVAMSRLPRASSPLGLSVLHLLAAAAGVVLWVREGGWRGAFWGLYPLPFLGYEVVLGRNLDYGLYVPFVLPPLCVLAALGVRWVGGLRRGGTWVSAALVVLLLLPSAVLHWRHWGSVVRDEAAHYSPTTLAAIWMARHLPENAVVIQPKGELGPNLVAYYWASQHAYCTRDESILFQSRGRFTPLNQTAFVPLTTDRLEGLIAAGRPVYAFEPAPLGRCDGRVIDASAFEWRRAAEVDLEAVAADLGLRERVLRGLRVARLALYRGSVRRPTDDGRR